MANQAAAPATRRPRRWARVVGRTFLILLLLAVLAAIIGASYQGIERTADARRFPRQGRLIGLGPEFGNLALNLNCQGQGSPTVILDSGLGVPGIGWNQVQMNVAQFARVCWYDRAGYGWSGASSTPRTSLQIAKELHTLLIAAGEPGPFVLVGHSFGGYNIRVYNGRYPGEVAGMVLVDASSEDQQSYLPPSFQHMMKKQQDSLRREGMLAPVLIGLGIVRFAQRRQPPTPGISKEFDQEIQYLQQQPKFLRAISSELEMLQVSADETRAAGNLGDKPLVVLTAGKAATPLPDGISKRDFDAFHNLWVNRLQRAESKLSTRGKQIIVPDSSHMIPFERPDAIVDAIREVCQAVRSQTGS